MPGKKFDSCVDKVKAKGKVDNAYAVCNASMQTIEDMLRGKQCEGGPGSGRHPGVNSVGKFSTKKIAGNAFQKSAIAMGVDNKHYNVHVTTLGTNDSFKVTRGSNVVAQGPGSKDDALNALSNHVISQSKESTNGITPQQTVSKSDLSKSLKHKDPQPGKTNGITSLKWFWPEADKSMTQKPLPAKKSGVGPQTFTDRKPADEQVLDVLTENPGINGSTLVNTLKSKGIGFVDNKEADTMGANAQFGVAGVNPLVKTKKKKKVAAKESVKKMFDKIKESKSINFRSNIFMEATARKDVDPGKYGLVFKSVLLQEGLGNLTDCYYYTKEALQSAVPLFEGKKIYANHPDKMQEQIRPERDVRDILGHFENVQLESDKDGRASLVADLVILPEESFDWARGLMKHSVSYAQKFPDKEFVGLSINASGDSEETKLDDYISANEIPESCLMKIQQAKEKGIDTIKPVSIMESAISCDLVTEAGAGGAILKLMEQEKDIMKKKKSVTKENETKLKPSGGKMEDEVKQSEDEKKEALGDADKGDGGDAGHDDAAQDKQLVAKMLKKHLGDEETSEEEMEMMHQAYEAYKEMGMEDEKCAEAAHNSMKLAKHMQAKKEAAGKEEEAEDAKIDKDGYHISEGEDKVGDGPAKLSPEKKEAEVLKLKGRVALLESKIKETETKEYLEEILKKSKLPTSVTKSFREAVGNLKTKVEVDAKFKTFLEGYKAGNQEGGFVISTEKNTFSDSSSGSLTFADCKLD